jgi:hypothetical protein
MVEFLIALVAVLVLAAGLLQLTALMLAQSRTMTKARKDAGIAAVQPLVPLSSAKFIRDWEEGFDTVSYSADDRVVLSSAASQFENLFVEKASTAPGWAYVGLSPSDRITPMRTILAPSSFFGLVDGHSEETVPLLPAVQSLLYRKSGIRVESKVWMTSCGGIY